MEYETQLLFKRLKAPYQVLLPLALVPLDIKLSVLLVVQAQCKCDTGRNTPRTKDKDENI